MQTWIERLHRTLLGTAVAWWRTQGPPCCRATSTADLGAIDALAACRITLPCSQIPPPAPEVSPGHGTDFHHGADFRTSCGNVGAGVGNCLVLQQIKTPAYRRLSRRCAFEMARHCDSHQRGHYRHRQTSASSLRYFRNPAGASM
jgi:hypothetical protein